MKVLNCIAMIILIIGGLNWGLVGAFDFNLVHAIFSSLPLVEKIVYIVVGVSALYGIYFTCLKCCGKKCE